MRLPLARRDHHDVRQARRGGAGCRAATWALRLVDAVADGVERIDDGALEGVDGNADLGDLLGEIARADAVGANGRHVVALVVELGGVQRRVSRPRLRKRQEHKHGCA